MEQPSPDRQPAPLPPHCTDRPLNSPTDRQSPPPIAPPALLPVITPSDSLIPNRSSRKIDLSPNKITFSPLFVSIGLLITLGLGMTVGFSSALGWQGQRQPGERTVQPWSRPDRLRSRSTPSVATTPSPRPTWQRAGQHHTQILRRALSLRAKPDPETTTQLGNHAQDSANSPSSPQSPPIPPQTTPPPATPATASTTLTPPPDRPDSDHPTPNPLPLTLSDAITLALQNNLSLKSAYLQRILDRQDLELAESQFSPQITPTLRITYNADRLGSSLREANTTTASVGTTLDLPTGANLTVALGGDHRLTPGQQNQGGQNLTVGFSQPLLRGFGVELNQIPIEIARLQEQSNLLALEARVMGVITRVIQAYYRLLQTQEELDIQRRSVERTQRQRQITEALIEAGRIPQIELVQADADEARRQLSLASAENSLQTQQLALTQLLDLPLAQHDRRVPVATEIPAVETLSPLLAQDLLTRALAQNPDYRQTQLALIQDELGLKTARDQQRWSLNLETQYQQNIASDAADRHNIDVGLTLSRTLGDRSQSQAVTRQEVAIQQQANALEQAEAELTVTVTNLRRDVAFNFEQVQLARRSRELAEQRLENERFKFERGLQGSKLDDVLRAEDAVVEARNSELATTITYLNTVARLEEVVGFTLETWNVILEAEATTPQD
ncbi:MAG: TolC family protein [Prochlorothrix sp.]|nr:TolC family protein [Prochlorothrix sp.]